MLLSLFVITSEVGLSFSFRGSRVRRSVFLYDVDLCLVSFCEFEYRKVVFLLSVLVFLGSFNDSSVRF